MNQSELLPSRKPGILQRSSVARPDDRQAMDETASTFSFPSAILFIRYPRVYVLVDAFNDAYRADLFAIFCKKYRNLSGRQAFDVFRFVRCSPGDHYQSSFAYNLRDIEMKWVSMLRVLPGNSSSGLVIRGDRYRWFYRGCCPSDVLHRCFCPSTVVQRKINEEISRSIGNYSKMKTETCRVRVNFINIVKLKTKTLKIDTEVGLM